MCKTRVLMVIENEPKYDYKISVFEVPGYVSLYLNDFDTEKMDETQLYILLTYY